MSVLRQIVQILRKDLLIEWRARSRAFALACFMVTILLLFSFAVGPDTATLRAHAGAYLWLSLLLSSTLLLAQSFHAEVESGAIEAVIDSTHPLSDIQAAQTRLESRQSFGKVILHP